MAANTIGTGAVVLTANADSLLSGLDKAQRSTEKWAANTGKGAAKALEGAAGKGGGLGKLFGGFSIGGAGLAAGGPAGAALAGIGVGLAVVAKGLEVGAELASAFVDRLSQVGERAKLYSNIDPVKQEGIDRTTAAFDRVTAAVDDFFFSAAGALAPALEKVASVCEVIGYVGGEAFGAVVDAIGDGVSMAVTFIDQITGLGLASTTAGKLTFDVLRGIGTGLAVGFDLAKAFGGGMAYAAGTIVEGFGQVLKILALAAKQLDAMARELPAAIRPDWIGKAAAAVDGFSDKAADVGAKLKANGKDAIGSFGDSVKGMDAWFDRIEKGFNGSERLKLGAAATPADAKMAGAMSKGGTEAYSVVAKFQAGNMVADGTKRLELINRGMWEELKELNKKLNLEAV